MSLNSSLYTSYSGVSASQASLTVTTNNMTNASTKGYTRQQAIHTSINPPQSYTLSSAGYGVKIGQVRRVNDQFLRENCRAGYNELSYFETTKNYLYEVETAFGDLYGYNMQTSTDEFFNAWEELAKSPSDQAARALVYESGVSFVDTLNQYDHQLDAIEDSVIMEIQNTVSSINSLSNELANVNAKIASSVDPPNELLDYQDMLLDDLSKLVTCTFTYQHDGTVDVTTKNGILVGGNSAYEIACVSKPPNGLPEAEWANGQAFDNQGGSLGALNDLLYNTLPEVKGVINDGMMQVIDKVNELHASGTGLDGSTGLDFFVAINPNEAFEIGNLQVNPDLSDFNKIGASVTGELGDGTLADEISLVQNESFITSGDEEVTIDQYIAAYTQWLGIISSDAQFEYENQQTLSLQLETQLSAVSSVSVDEEMANMMMFQQAYNANINVMNTVDELLENLIRELG
ncbi:flagellar hook-associated protein FlgK [Acidaminobacter sp. JC074]|uniref:flagellar hook-associated protein FlgK n=1 Tax=Acidaminobacter sp. JC074 TaxID=2530199 RepID=UPI001F0D84DD|nr:flagellar hook-associated protein FlgK [Acidaminobacter sp. JC074]MCH4887434.1 flagellar hook-associated protein FlgK [Acidaminobacter sp. JC074]